MKKLLLLMALISLLSANTQAKTLDQKKEELKKIYEAGGISKFEYESRKRSYFSLAI